MITGNMHKSFGEVRLCGFRVMGADRHTGKETTLITILRTPPGGEVKTGIHTGRFRLARDYTDDTLR